MNDGDNGLHVMSFGVISPLFESLAYTNKRGVLGFFCHVGGQATSQALAYNSCTYILQLLWMGTSI
jgi:hypothetical protein